MKAQAGSVTLDTVPLVMLYSRTSVSDSSSDVFCETQEPGPDSLITNPLFDCSTLGSGTLPSPLVESVETSLQFEVPPLFPVIQESAPNSLLVKARAGLITSDMVPWWCPARILSLKPLPLW